MNFKGYFVDHVPGGIDENHETLKGQQVFGPSVVK
jgi:hypothetical protein